MKKYLIHIAFVLHASILHGQSVEPLPGQHHNPLSHFASLYSVKQVSDFSLVNLSYKNFDGDFNRPQLPASGYIGAFTASGRQKHNNLIWQGNFSFKYQRDEDQQWNNTSLHPDTQPFLWADAATGRWDRNHFSADVQLGSAYEGNYQWGAGLFFHGGQGDRFNDPKPLYRYRRFGIAPEIAVRFSNRNWLALQLLYIDYSEDNEMGFFSVDDPLLYRLRGYGTFSRTPFVSGERELSSQSVGATIQWVRPGRWAIQFGGMVTQGNAEEGAAIITPGGEWESLKANFSTEKYWQGTSNISSIQLQGQFSEIEGIDAVFQAVNARLQTARVAIDWNIATSDSMAFNWRANVGTAFTHRLQEDLAAFTEAQVQGIPLDVNFRVAWKKDKLTPFVAATGNYFQVLSSSLEVGDTNALTDLVFPDFEILSASSLTMRLAAGVDWQYSKGVVRLSAFAQRLQDVESNTSLHQNQFGLSLAFSPQGVFDLGSIYQETISGLKNH